MIHGLAGGRVPHWCRTAPSQVLDLKMKTVVVFIKPRAGEHTAQRAHTECDLRCGMWHFDQGEEISHQLRDRPACINRVTFCPRDQLLIKPQCELGVHQTAPGRTASLKLYVVYWLKPLRLLHLDVGFRLIQVRQQVRHTQRRKRVRVSPFHPHVIRPNEMKSLRE
jgi:hypothetical protein